MDEIRRFDIDESCDVIKLANVPALTRPRVSLVKDVQLSQQIVIEADRKMKPLKLTFSCEKKGSTFIVYFHRTDDLDDPSFLTAISFTVRMPQEYEMGFA